MKKICFFLFLILGISFATVPFLRLQSDIENVAKLASTSDRLRYPLALIASSIHWTVGTIIHLVSIQSPDISSVKLPYFRFIPEYIMSLDVNSSESFSSRCFKENYINVINNNSSFSVSIRSKNPSNLFCQDFYMIGNYNGMAIDTVWKKGLIKVDIPYSNGNLYLFRFKGTPPEMLYSLLETAKLFQPYITKDGKISDSVRNSNLELLHKMANMSMPESTQKGIYIINPNKVRSGDLLAIMRLDGLLPMEGFGMGSGTGHVAVALWIGKELYVVESTDKTNYWPVRGIQKTKWWDWMKMAHDAEYIVEYLPLNDGKRNQFDNDAAIRWFESVEGLPYGYNNYLFCWVDTTNDNYPPPLSSEFMEVGMSYIGKHLPSIAEKMWNQALRKRLNVFNLNSTADLIKLAYIRDIPFGKLMSIPEMDDWVYDDGKSMVCSVFVCSLWKAAGLFGNIAKNIQCTEFHNWDAYSLMFFNESNECGWPCHIMGDYMLDLNGANTKKPYRNMAERCPSLPPKYYRPKKC